MLPVVATPRLQMKVRAMIRPNKVSEIRSIGSSTRPKRVSETSDIESNARRLNLQGKFAECSGRRSRPFYAELARSTVLRPAVARTYRLRVRRYQANKNR